MRRAWIAPRCCGGCEGILDSKLAAAHYVLRAMCARIDGLRHCPDCGADLEERAPHAESCPIGGAMALLGQGESIFDAWLDALLGVANAAIQLVAADLHSVTPGVLLCAKCQGLNTHAEACAYGPLGAALENLAAKNKDLA